ALLSEMAGLLEARGDLDEAAAALRRAMVTEPLEEDLAVRLVRVLALTGRRREAAEAYDRFAAALESEIGAEPSLEAPALGPASGPSPRSPPSCGRGSASSGCARGTCWARRRRSSRRSPTGRRTPARCRAYT